METFAASVSRMERGLLNRLAMVGLHFVKEFTDLLLTGCCTNWNPNWLDPQIKIEFLSILSHPLLFLQYLVFLTDSLWFTAPCNITIERGRILYKGKNLWIENFKSNRVLHNEMVSVYCMNEARNCSYVVRTQCRDGRLDMPECFEGKEQWPHVWLLQFYSISISSKDHYAQRRSIAG